MAAMAAVTGTMEVVATQTGMEDTLAEEGEDSKTTDVHTCVAFNPPIKRQMTHGLILGSE